MAEPHVITALIAKRAEIAGKIEATQSELRSLIIDLDHVDAALRIFDPDIDLSDVRPRALPARHRSFRGGVQRTVLAALRKSNKPMAAYELAKHVMAERGLDMSDKRLLVVVAKRVGASLRQMRAKNYVRSIPAIGRRVLWEVAQ